MTSTVQANDVLRRHMLFISAPLSSECSVSESRPHFSRTIVVDTRHESVVHASRHLEAVERGSDVSVAEELREAFVTCCSTTQRFPTPEVTLAEFMRIFYAHMRYHTDSDGALTSEYILRALSLFFVCERSEAQQRYATPLVELGVLQPVDTSRFVCVGPHPPQLHHLPLRELLSRFVCLFCHQSCMEGGNELIYLSHSRWVFAPRPKDHEEPAALTDSPFSPFPEALRRGLLGPLMQFVTTFCIADCQLRGARASDVCIVRLDGVKLALCQIAPSNVPLYALNPETGAQDRRDCPVTALFGFPNDFPDAELRLTVQRMLDMAEMRAGPRGDFSARIGQSPIAFRRRCRAMGRVLFRMANAAPWREALLGNGPLPPRTFALAADLMCDVARAVAPTGLVRAAVLTAGPFVLLSDAHPHVAALLRMDAVLGAHSSAVDLKLPAGALADETFGGANEDRLCSDDNNSNIEIESDGEEEWGEDDSVDRRTEDRRGGKRKEEEEEKEKGKEIRRRRQRSAESGERDDWMWGRSVHTASGAELRVRWRYLSASLVRLLHCGDNECVKASEAKGQFFRTVFIASCGVRLVIIVGDGIDATANAPRGSDAQWRALAAQCLSLLVARDHAMANIATAIASAAASEHEAPGRSAGAKRTECTEGLFLRRGIGSSSCSASGEAIFAGAAECPPSFARDTRDVHALLGTPLMPAGNNNCSEAPAFAFANLPVTRVVLGRGAFGGRGVVFGRRAGGEDHFFAPPPQGSAAAFAHIEEEFSAFIRAHGDECGTVL